MFEPLPSFIRQQRVRQDLSQEGLAKMAKVSRGQLVAFEKGEQNVTLAFLLKIARALNLTKLPIADLSTADTPVDLEKLTLAINALATAREVLSEIAALNKKLEAAARTINPLVEEVLARSVADSRATDATERPAATPASTARAARPRSTAKAAERKRSR